MQKSKQEVDRACITTAELQQMLGCGLPAARKLGREAKAEIKIGSRRTLWFLPKIMEYLANQTKEE